MRAVLLLLIAGDFLVSSGSRSARRLRSNPTKSAASRHPMLPPEPFAASPRASTRAAFGGLEQAPAVNSAAVEPSRPPDPPRSLLRSRRVAAQQRLPPAIQDARTRPWKSNARGLLVDPASFASAARDDVRLPAARRGLRARALGHAVSGATEEARTLSEKLASEPSIRSAERRVPEPAHRFPGKSPAREA